MSGTGVIYLRPHYANMYKYVAMNGVRETQKKIKDKRSVNHREDNQ